MQTTSMGRKNGNDCGKLAKFEQPRKKKKNNKRKDFDMNGKYNQKSVRKLESFVETRNVSLQENENGSKKRSKLKKKH